ncbi:MAG: endonuclease/exonuclease/phosphatase family protein [Actinobacteria bacterium]|nr:endonuclease/exonuclease/phosphatase family protein [Actinomycetota bacterium]
MLRKRLYFIALIPALVTAGLAGSANALDPTPLEPIPVVDGVPVCGTEGAGTPSDDGVLKVASFNVLHSDTQEGDLTLGARLELEADAIVTSGADVVGMQEVTKNVDYDNGTNNAEFPQKHGTVAQRFATELAGRTSSAWHWCFFRSNPHVPGTPDIQPGGGNPLDDLAAMFGNTPDPGDFSEGLALVAKYPILDPRSHRLLPRSYESPACIPPDPLACNLAAIFDSRQVIYGEIDLPGDNVEIFDTHIAHGLTDLSNTTKKLQVDQVLAWIELWQKPGIDEFLTGDFNSTPDTDRYDAVIDAGFTDTYLQGAGASAECNPATGVGCTGNPPPGQEVFTTSGVTTRKMSERIDYVFARGCAASASAILGTNTGTWTDGRVLWPSDHLGLVSTVDCA